MVIVKSTFPRTSVEVRYLKGRWRAEDVSGAWTHASKEREDALAAAEEYLAEHGGELRVYDHRDGAKGEPVFISEIAAVR